MLFKYNQSKSVLYARNFVKQGNPFYEVFDEEKEDCNFVSQCILAGCDCLNSKICEEWFYENEKKHSFSWVDKRELLKYLLSSSHCGPSGRLVNKLTLTAGDLVFLEKNEQVCEVGIVTKIEEDKIYFISRRNVFEEKCLHFDEKNKIYFVHIVGVKR